MRHNYPARRNEGVGLSEGCLSNIAREIVSEIRPVRQIKHLEQGSYRILFLDPEVFTDAGVELEIWLSAQLVKRIDCTLASPNAIAVLDSVGIRSTRIAERSQCGLQIVGTGGENNYAICSAAAQP